MGNITLNQIYTMLGVLVAIVGTLGAVKKIIDNAIATIYKPVTELKKEVTDLREDVTALQKGLTSQLRTTILKSSEDYLDKGYANVNQKEALNKAFEDYELNGGNSFVHELVEQVNKLPTKKG